MLGEVSGRREGDERQWCEAPCEEARVGDPWRDPHREVPTSAAQVSEVVIECKLHTQRGMTIQKRSQCAQQCRSERGGGGHAHRTGDPDRCAKPAGGSCEREGRASDLSEEALTVRREGECAGRATEQARTVRDLEAADKTGNGGRGHAEQARGPGEGTSLGNAENDHGGAESVHIAFNTLCCGSNNTVCSPLNDCPFLSGRHQERRDMMRIGIVGIGPVGQTLGTVWARAGHEVAFGSRDSDKAAAAVKGLAAAHATTQEEAAAFAEVVLWTPRGVMPADPNLLAGKIVLDPNNREPDPGRDYASPRPNGPSYAERLQAAAPQARVVKAFNTIVMRVLRETPERLAASGTQVLLASDDAEAKATVTSLIDSFGFDVVDAGPLAEGWRIQRDTPGYGVPSTAEQLTERLAAAKRYRDM